jgi:hypothetical protein
MSRAEGSDIGNNTGREKSGDTKRGISEKNQATAPKKLRLPRRELLTVILAEDILTRASDNSAREPRRAQEEFRGFLFLFSKVKFQDLTLTATDIDASSRLEENVGRPLGSYFYSISTMHCMSVSLGLNGEGLGTSWGEEKARELLAEAGFTRVDVHRVEGDIINSYYIAKKQSV